MANVPRADEIPAIDDPRKRLIAAGARALADDGFRILAAGISPTRIAEAAGRSRRTFYEHFETKEDYLRAVFAEYLDPDPDSMPEERVDAELLASMTTAPGGGLLQAATALAEHHFAQVAESESSRLRAIAWSTSLADPQILTALRAHSEAVDEIWEENFDRTVATWGLEFRPPWNARRFAQSVLAASSDLYRRSHLDGEDRRHVFSFVTTTLMASAFRRVEEPDEPLADRFAALGRAAVIDLHERSDPAAAVTARRRLLTAMEDLLGEKTLSQMTLGEIADRAGVSLGSVQATFPTKTALFAELVTERLPPFADQVEFDRRTTDMGTQALLQRHLARLRSWSEVNPSLVSAIASGMTEPSAPGAAVLRTVLDPTAAILRRAQTDGEFTTPVKIGSLATILTMGSLGAALFPGAPDSDWLVELILRGLENPVVVEAAVSS